TTSRSASASRPTRMTRRERSRRATTLGRSTRRRGAARWTRFVGGSRRGRPATRRPNATGAAPTAARGPGERGGAGRGGSGGAVVVHELTLTAFTGPEAAAFSMRCSKGTYVRALARDLGRALGVGAHVTALRRTRSGPFSLAEARPLDAALAALTAGDRAAL